MINEIIPKEKINIEDIIYEIRGKQVMLDSDLAKLYQCTNGTKDINKAVKRNIERFPEDFYFQLSIEECSRFHFGTLIKNRAKNELIIIDNYADINTLNLIKKLDVKVIIISNNKRYLTREDIDKYNSEYNNLNVIFINSFHDRYIIIDNKDVYFLGSSINNIGSKISSIIKCKDKELNNILLNRVQELKNIPTKK